MGLLSKLSRAIKAYHGSPHDFERFSMAHIGRGEGAQAYGRGLYFAEAEDVARSYRDALSASRLDPGSTEFEVARQLRRFSGLRPARFRRRNLWCTSG